MFGNRGVVAGAKTLLARLTEVVDDLQAIRLAELGTDVRFDFVYNQPQTESFQRCSGLASAGCLWVNV